MKLLIESFVAGGLTALLWLAPITGVHATDDYLSVLEAEAEDTGGQEARTSTVSVVTHEKNKSARIDRSIVPNLGFEEFERELRSSYSGTHLLYMKLPRDRQRTAWKSYLENNDLRAVRERIVNLLSSG